MCVLKVCSQVKSRLTFQHHKSSVRKFQKRKDVKCEQLRLTGNLKMTVFESMLPHEPGNPRVQGGRGDPMDVDGPGRERLWTGQWTVSEDRGCLLSRPQERTHARVQTRTVKESFKRKPWRKGKNKSKTGNGGFEVEWKEDNSRWSLDQMQRCTGRQHRHRSVHSWDAVDGLRNMEVY